MKHKNYTSMTLLKFIAALANIALLCLVSGCGAGNNPAVIVMGSTSVQPYAEIIAEEYVHLNPGREVDVLGGGSSAGIMAVESGIADVGMSSRALKPAEQYLWSVEIAKDGLALITHVNNPVSDLTLEQVRGIYSGALTNWRDVGGADAKIHVITREEGSGSRDSFESLVMEKISITPRAIVQDSNGAVKQLVSGDINSIGFISSGLAEGNVKALSLNGVSATYENIINGSYVLYRPFLFVSKDLPDGHSMHFIEFVLSAEGRRILEAEGLVTK
jgi:phosphate transport system substrate-binding protein